jgi:hypothetical protein
MATPEMIRKMITRANFITDVYISLSGLDLNTSYTPHDHEV